MIIMTPPRSTNGGATTASTNNGQEERSGGLASEAASNTAGLFTWPREIPSTAVLLKRAHNLLVSGRGGCFEDELYEPRETAAFRPRSHNRPTSGPPTKLGLSNHMSTLIGQREALTAHIITTLVALNEVNRELERMLLAQPQHHQTHQEQQPRRRTRRGRMGHRAHGNAICCARVFSYLLNHAIVSWVLRLTRSTKCASYCLRELQSCAKVLQS